MGRKKQMPLPVEVEETRARFQAWRQSRKNGERLPMELWSEAVGLARRLGVERVRLALGLNHTTLKEHVMEGQVATKPVRRPRLELPQPAFVALDGSHFLDDLPAGVVLEVTHREGERMMLRWPAGSVVDACGLVSAFLRRVL